MKHRLSLIALICLLVAFPATGRGQEVPLADYRVEGVADYGGLRRFHADERGVYYFGVYKWQDPEWDSSYWLAGIVAFIHPRGADGTLVMGDESDEELHSMMQRVFRVAPTETDRFNDILLPALKSAFPKLDLNQDIAMHAYALGTHFEDSEAFFRHRADQKIIPEQPLLALTWRRAGSRFVPVYEALGQPGQAVTRGSERIFWPTLTAARTDRRAAGQTAAVAAPSIPDLYRRYEKQTAEREAAVANARRADAERFVRQKAEGSAVFRNDVFWSGYRGLETARVIFDGEFGRITDFFEAAAVYVGFLEAFDRECHTYLPPKRVTVTRQWYTRRGDGPWLPDGPPSQLTMDARYHEKYESMRAAAAGNDALRMLGAVFGGAAADPDASVHDALAEMLEPAAELLRRQGSMQRMMSDSGCASATVRQLGDNLLALANAEPPVQGTGRRYAGAEAESQPPAPGDFERELALRTMERERMTLLAAANPKEGPDGWPHAQEQLRSYDINRNADQSAYRQSPAYRDAVKAVRDRRHPVLRCQYGPTGMQGERPTWRSWSLWYDHVPPEALAILAVDRDRHPGFAVAATECPATSGALLRLLEEG